MSIAALQVLFDVDNTLLDNDAFGADLDRQLRTQLGDEGRERYWRTYEALRERHGYVDYLESLQRLRDAGEDPAALAALAEYVLAYPFADRLYPGALAAIAHAATMAPVAILTDGDIVFQPRKIRRSGLWQAVGGRVLVCVHKEAQVDELQRRFPAKHYVLVDDKPALLVKMKNALGTRLTTIWVRQGHYAREAGAAPSSPAFDHCIEAIAQLRDLHLANLHAGATAASTEPSP